MDYLLNFSAGGCLQLYDEQKCLCNKGWDNVDAGSVEIVSSDMRKGGDK